MNRDTVYIGLGSNLGERKLNLEHGLEALLEHTQIKLLRNSSIYETLPEGYLEQPLFYNMVTSVETTLEPLELLDYCLHVESLLKRKRLIPMGPRVLDLDILYIEEKSLHHERLHVPHPRMHERAFVMVPLLEIAPHLEDAFENPTWERNVSHVRLVEDVLACS